MPLKIGYISLQSQWAIFGCLWYPWWSLSDVQVYYNVKLCSDGSWMFGKLLKWWCVAAGLFPNHESSVVPESDQSPPESLSSELQILWRQWHPISGEKITCVLCVLSFHMSNLSHFTISASASSSSVFSMLKCRSIAFQIIMLKYDSSLLTQQKHFVGSVLFWGG